MTSKLKADLKKAEDDLAVLEKRREEIKGTIDIALEKKKACEDELVGLRDDLSAAMIRGARKGGNYDEAQVIRVRISELEDIIANAVEGVPGLKPKLDEAMCQCREAGERVLSLRAAVRLEDAKKRFVETIGTPNFKTAIAGELFSAAEAEGIRSWPEIISGFDPNYRRV